MSRILKFAALALFILAGVGFATLSFGTVTFSLIGFGLAAWVGSEL